MFRVSTRSMAENGFLDIATRLQMPASTWEAGKQGLANIQQPWMLVLDNADDLNIDYQDYFPPGSSGVVVLTLTASYGIGRLFGVSHLATLKRRRLRRSHRWQLVHDRPEPGVAFGL